MTFYRRDLPHLQRDNKAHFVTFTTHNRTPLPPWARDIVLAACLHDHGKLYDLDVAVVMPDHVHLIYTPLVDHDRMEVVSLARIMHGIKGVSSHRINKGAGRTGRVWQEKSFDHVLRSSESLTEKVEYVLQNPVRRGLVTSPCDYSWLWRRE